ncbi:MAG: biotin/lipoyl-binding protein, partial [Verrucomicrobiota bacterium]
MSDSKPVSEHPPPPAVNSKQLAKLNSPLFIWPATGALAVLLFFGLGYFFDVLTHESTDDAFITADVVSIAPRISGQVSAVHVLANQMVHSNDLLVEIDPADYAMIV